MGKFKWDFEPKDMLMFSTDKDEGVIYDHLTDEFKQKGLANRMLSKVVTAGRDGDFYEIFAMGLHNLDRSSNGSSLKEWVKEQLHDSNLPIRDWFALANIDCENEKWLGRFP